MRELDLFRYKNILLSINIFVIFLAPLSDLFADKWPFSPVSTVLGVSILVFLICDVAEFIRNKEDK